MGFVIGTELLEAEIEDLAKRWVNRVYASAAGLRHVDHLTGKELVAGGGRDRDFSGIAIPYYLPGSDHPVTYRLRRANPEVDERTGKPKGKYLSAPSDRNQPWCASHSTVPPWGGFRFQSTGDPPAR